MSVIITDNNALLCDAWRDAKQIFNQALRGLDDYQIVHVRESRAHAPSKS